MERHVHLETGESDARESCERADSRSVSSCETVDPSRGVDERLASPSPGIPWGDLPLPDLQEFVVEAIVRRFVMDERPRSRRAAAAVMRRFARRHGLQVYRIGRNRLYRARDFFEALDRESGIREERLFRRGIDLS